MLTALRLNPNGGNYKRIKRSVAKTASPLFRWV